MAAFHATWWEHPQLTEWEWLSPLQEEQMTLARAIYQGCWGPFQAVYASLLAPEIKSLGSRLAESLPRMNQALSAEPQTLAHFDYKADNLFFREDGGECSLVAIDWQSVTGTRGVYDLAYFLAWSLPPEDRRA
ncbi:MAG: hypothetical protein C4321_10170 [Chloroflexota bacterium]